MSVLVVTSECQLSLHELLKEPLPSKHPPLSPFLNFGPTHQNRPGSFIPFQSKKKSSDLSAALFVDSKGGLGGSFQLKRPGLGVKTTGITDFNGNNRVIIGMNIPFGNRRSGSRFGSRSTANFKSPWNNADH